MKRYLCVAMMGLLAACVATAADEKIVTLTVEEEAGVDRGREPITTGVPLPEGKVTDVSQLYLVGELGNRIPCQVTEVCKWLDKTHVKWVHVTWNQSVLARHKARVSLMKSDRPTRVEQAVGIEARKEGNVVTVQNGYVKFVVLGPKFDGFHQAWFDATGKRRFNDKNLVIDGAGGGGSKVTVGGQEFLSTNDPEGKVEIEEQGRHRVVVKATGRHMGKAAKALDYIVRFYAYADSPIVKVSHTFVCAQGAKAADNLLIDKISFDVPTKGATGPVAIGTDKKPLRAGHVGEIHQDTSDSFTVTHERADIGPVKGKGKSTKPLTTGWIDLEGTLAVGVKWFWQMYPKRLAVTTNGEYRVIRIGLFPGAERPLEAFMGISRTHYLTFLFHHFGVKEKQLNDFFAGTQRPLRAWAPGKYYCRDTHCFGYAIENDPKLFGDDWPKVQKWNAVQLKSVQMLLEKLDNNTYNGITRDSYGIYAWGDRYHWGWPQWGASPRQTPEWKQSWAGNYYDYPNAMLMAFLRTGDKTFLKRFFPNAIQIGDVHTMNYHPNPKLVGACRYCPPRNFVAVDSGKPYSSVEYNHYKTQSVFAHWYLTGDRRSLDHCKMLANVAYANHAADRGWAARGIGAQMVGLWNAYELTLDKKYFDRLKGMAYRAMAQFKRGKYRKGGFHDGIANEGLCHYYWVSGDKAVIDTFLAGYPKNRGRSSHPNMAFGAAMTYRVTGDQQYADWAWKALSRQKPSSRVHNPGCQFRGSHFALYFLSKASEGWKPTLGP